MKRCAWLMAVAVVLLGWSASSALARPNYKMIIDGLDAKTDAEKSLQESVKADGCNHCHDKKDKKIRTEAGMKLHKALGGEDYKFDKDFWAKQGDNFSDAAVKKLRDAINAAAKAAE